MGQSGREPFAHVEAAKRRVDVIRLSARGPAGDRMTSGRLRRSLRASTIDGVLHAAMMGIGETYFPAFALLLGASPFQVGLLTTVPILAGSAFQLLVPLAARRLGNKRWVVGSAVLQGLTFLPVAAMATRPPEAYLWLLALVCLYWVLQLGTNPAWNAWMGRLVPPRIRSRYFGRRNGAIQFSLTTAMVVGGFAVHAAEAGRAGAAAGFAAAFLCAAACRFGSAWFLARQHEPPGAAALEPSGWSTVLGDFRREPHGRLIALVVLLMGSVHVAAAYFTPFMLDELHLSYAQFTILNATIMIARVFASPYWGEIAHRFGNRRALQVATALVSPLSGLWVVSGNFFYLLGLQLVAGFAWAGLELTIILNFFDYTTDRNRAEVLAVYNLLNGLAIVAGSLAGGTVLRRVGSAGYPYIFLASSALRALTFLVFGRRLPPVRAAEHAFRHVFLRVLSLRAGQDPDLPPSWPIPARAPRARSACPPGRRSPREDPEVRAPQSNRKA